MSSVLTQFIGWSVIPGLAANMIQMVLYKFIRDPPARGTSQYSKDYRRIFAFGVSLYIIYTLYNADKDLGTNYYQVLGLDRFQVADDALLRRQSRAVSMRYHPDKNKSPEAVSIFMMARSAVDVFSSWDSRMAYEKMGPKVAELTRATTYREYILSSLQGYVMRYLIDAAILVLLNMFGQASYGKYWRFSVLLALFSVEGMLLFKQSSIISDFFYTVMPHRATFQHIEFLHSFFVSFSIAQNQVGPLLFPPQEHETSNSTVQNNPKIRPLIERLAILSTMLARDSEKELKGSLEPLKDNPEALSKLTTKMRQIAVDGALHSNEAVRDAYRSATEAPSKPIPEATVTDMKTTIGQESKPTLLSLDGKEES